MPWTRTRSAFASWGQLKLLAETQGSLRFLGTIEEGLGRERNGGVLAGSESGNLTPLFGAPWAPE